MTEPRPIATSAPFSLDGIAPKLAWERPIGSSPSRICAVDAGCYDRMIRACSPFSRNLTQLVSPLLSVEPCLYFRERRIGCGTVLCANKAA